MDEQAQFFLKCQPCGTVREVLEEQIESGTYQCPGCGRTYYLEDESDTRLRFLTSDGPEVCWYLAPLMTCDCGELIELPYSNIPQTDEKGKLLLKGEDPPTLPSGEWSEVFGCLQCGLIRERFDWDVKVWPIPKVSEGQYQSGKGVWRVEFPCGSRGCTTLASMYVDIGNRNASEVESLIRSGVFDGKVLPCGHEMRTVPEKFYKVEAISRRLW